MSQLSHIKKKPGQHAAFEAEVRDTSAHSYKDGSRLEKFIKRSPGQLAAFAALSGAYVFGSYFNLADFNLCVSTFKFRPMAAIPKF